MKNTRYPHTPAKSAPRTYIVLNVLTCTKKACKGRNCTRLVAMVMVKGKPGVRPIHLDEVLKWAERDGVEVIYQT